MTSVLGSVAISFSDEQSMLMDVARGFLADKAPTDKIREFLESDRGYEASLWQEMVDLGWTGIALPEHVGGAGLGVAALIPVIEAMGHSLLGTPLIEDTFNQDRWDYVYLVRNGYETRAENRLTVHFEGDSLSRLSGTMRPGGSSEG